MKDPAQCRHPLPLQSTSVWSTAVPPEHPGFSRTIRTICRQCGTVLEDETTGPYVDEEEADDTP
jgi:hypothetical protein